MGTQTITSASSTWSTSAGRIGFMKLACRSTRRFWSTYRNSTTSPWSADDVIPEVSIFGKDPRICLIGPSSCRRTCEIGTIVSPVSSRDERATAVYITHPYLWNRSPAWVTTWSRGIGPSTATLRLARFFMFFMVRPPLRGRQHYVSSQPPTGSPRQRLADYGGGDGAELLDLQVARAQRQASRWPRCPPCSGGARRCSPGRRGGLRW